MLLNAACKCGVWFFKMASCCLHWSHWPRCSVQPLVRLLPWRQQGSALWTSGGQSALSEEKKGGRSFSMRSSPPLRRVRSSRRPAGTIDISMSRAAPAFNRHYFTLQPLSDSARYPLLHTDPGPVSLPGPFILRCSTPLLLSASLHLQV